MDETGLFWLRMSNGGLWSKGSPGFKEDRHDYFEPKTN